MVIVKVLGGLGNQLFQYAFAQQLKQMGCEVKLDISWFDENTLPHGNGYQLEKLYNLSEEYADENEVSQFVIDTPPGIKRKFLRLLQVMGIYKKRHYTHLSNHYEYDERLMSTIIRKREGFIFGYYQNINWFRNIQDKLQETIVVDIDSLNDINRKLIENMKRENAVALHVRKFSSEGTEAVLDFDLEFEYYENAIRKMIDLIDNPRFYIFSDDIEWCKTKFKQIDATYVDNNSDYEDQYIDMHIMSYCKNIIISNSTYGWWSAWLNPMQNEKNVIAPKIWARSLPHSNPVIKQWIEIDN